MSDSENRKLIADDLDSNIMVEAAAGTGKTTGIVGRMVNLIATGRCQIENLAATTFTRKAAAELRERFQAKLRQELNSDRPDGELDRIKTAIDRIEFAFVGTFHSFCSLMLRERPIEFGVEPGFREIDPAEAKLLCEQAWQAFLDELYSTGREKLDRIHSLGLKTNELKTCFFKFLEFRDIHQWPHDLPAQFDLEATKREVRAYVEDMRLLIPFFNAPADRGTDETMERYEKILLASDNIDWDRNADFFNFLELFDSTSIKTIQKYWHDKAVAKREKTRYHDVRQNTVGPAFQWWGHYRYEFLIGLLANASVIYETIRSATGGLDFQDLLLHTAKGLKETESLREYFQKRFTHVLVDEFQDTDPLQAEILAYLTSSDNSQTDWKSCIPLPGSLFVVGDPKQSIYRFRRADIVTYKQVKQIFEQSGGKILSLSRNFRSEQSICDWVNPIFGDLLGANETKYSPAAVDMEHGRNGVSEGELSGVHKLVIQDGLNKQADAVPWEAEQIAKYISLAIAEKKTVARTESEFRQGKSSHVEPGDFLIIVRGKELLHHYSDALDQLGISNTVTGSRAFKNIAELKTIYDILLAVDDSKNPIPYVSILRGELFGFGDADLYELKRLGGRFSYTSPIPTGLTPELQSRFEGVNKRMAKYRNWIRNMPFASAFEKIASDIGLLARCSSHLDGDIVAGGFLKAVEWIRAQSWDFDSAIDMITFLKDLIDSTETDTCSVLPPDSSSVRIMNLHKVKGLEAPIVFLACTFGKGSYPPEFHVDRSEEVAKGYLAIEKVIGKGFRKKRRSIATPADWVTYSEEEVLFGNAEENRLLYVACTRAACQLVVSTSSKDQYSPWKELHPYLESAPALKVPAEGKAAVTNSIPSMTQTIEEATDQIGKTWSSLQTPSYAVVAAKSVAMKQSKARPTWRASGDYGHQWGTAIHQLLEVRMNNPSLKLESMAQQLAEQFDLGSGRVAELLSTVETVAKSDIWARAERAKKIYTEIPFETVTNTGSAATLVPTITRGVIDLCFNENDGWVLVDYKTDDISTNDLPDAVEYYREQMRSYSNFWQSITGQPVLETGLYFSKPAKYTVVS